MQRAGEPLPQKEAGDTNVIYSPRSFIHIIWDSGDIFRLKKSCKIQPRSVEELNTTALCWFINRLIVGEDKFYIKAII